jgi:hypothetical protein
MQIGSFFGMTLQSHSGPKPAFARCRGLRIAVTAQTDSYTTPNGTTKISARVEYH